jgi:hypothetical protein
MSNLNLFIPITKVDAAQRLVYGVISEEIPDKSGEILDYASAKPEFQKWSGEIEKATDGKSKGNLRAMHDNIAAGKFVDITFDDEAKRIQGVAKVIDDNEWAKVEAGVYSGFSIGGGYAKRWSDPQNPQLKRYTPTLSEVSLVDNPCVPTATFEFIKEDGSTELRKFTAKREVSMADGQNEDTQADAIDSKAEKVEKSAEAPADGTPEETALEKSERPQDKGGVIQGFQAKDGSFHLKKADALRRNSEIEAEQIAAPALDALKKLDDAMAKADAAHEPEEQPAELEKSADPDPVQVTEPGEVAKAAEAAKAAEPAEEAPEAEDGLKKGMYGVSRFAELLQSIQFLQEDTAWEAEWEGDDSTLPAKLKSWLAEGGKLLVQMTREETAELTAAKSAGGDLAKDAGDSEADILAKREFDALKIENVALKKALGDITPKLEGFLKKFEEQSERIAHLEKQPMPAKGALRVVNKTQDGGNDSDGDIVKKFNQHLETLPPEEKSNQLMKLALANPVVINR